MDIRPELSAALDAFGLPCVVTPPDGDPVSTTAFWLPWRPQEVPAGGEVRRLEPLRVLVLPLSEVGSVPRNTSIRIADDGSDDADTREWFVDASERVAQDECRVMVRPNE